MSSTLLYKPAGVKLSKKDLNLLLVDDPKHVGILFSDLSKLRMSKHSKKINGIEPAFQQLEKLTKYPLLAFFNSEKSKKFIRNRNNMPPIIINPELGYVGCGALVSLPYEVDKQFSDVFYFNTFAFQPIVKSHPNFFFTYEGMWLLDEIIPSSTSIAFMKVNGEIALAHKERWDEFNGVQYFDSIVAAKQAQNEKNKKKK